MWLSSSSVGRKFIMALTGAALVLFVTFHCLLNAIAICWPTAYNSVCEFLGANWYALVASVALAALIVIHIIYAVVLTMKNRKARGDQRYAISKRPATVEWSSNNMLVLGIVILAFLVVHLIQFWAKMQLQEIRGAEEVLPPAAGTLFIQEAFELPWTAIVYIIGFIALWFHLQHGIWSMFQSVGWDSTVWIPRLKKVACWWASLVVLCFIAQAIVFTVKSHEDYFKNDPALRNQYQGMYAAMMEKDFGPDAANYVPDFKLPYEKYSQELTDNIFSMDAYFEFMPDSVFDQQVEIFKQQNGNNPTAMQQLQTELDNRATMKEILPKMKRIKEFYNYLEGKDATTPRQELVDQYNMQKMQMELQKQSPY